jgi:hypothetical protein
MVHTQSLDKLSAIWQWFKIAWHANHFEAAGLTPIPSGMSRAARHSNHSLLCLDSRFSKSLWRRCVASVGSIPAFRLVFSQKYRQPS